MAINNTHQGYIVRNAKPDPSVLWHLLFVLQSCNYLTAAMVDVQFPDIFPINLKNAGNATVRSLEIAAAGSPNAPEDECQQGGRRTVNKIQHFQPPPSPFNSSLKNTNLLNLCLNFAPLVLTLLKVYCANCNVFWVFLLLKRNSLWQQSKEILLRILLWCFQWSLDPGNCS